LIERRKLLLLAPAGLLAAALAGAGGWMALHRDEGPIPIGGPFRLRAGDGREVTEADFRGRWMLVYFGYTRCPDACPTALQDMANALDAMGPDAKQKVAIVFITIDPERDTPAVVQDYVSVFNAPITGLSGTPEQIAAVAKAYRVYYAKHPRSGQEYDMDHSSIIYVMDPRGRFVANFTHETAPDAIAAKLRSVMG
jgi:protein SCO1/2